MNVKSMQNFCKKGFPDQGKPFSCYLLLLQPVQLSSGLMHGSFLPGKNASIGNSIWLKTSHGLSVPAVPDGGQVFDGTQ